MSPNRRERRLVRIAIGGVGAFVAVVFFAFAKGLPFLGGGHRVDAVFSSSNQLRKGRRCASPG